MKRKITQTTLNNVYNIVPQQARKEPAVLYPRRGAGLGMFAMNLYCNAGLCIMFVWTNTNAG